MSLGGNVRISFIIEIVKQSNDTPDLRVFRKPIRVGPQSCFDGQHMPPERITRGVFCNQFPCLFMCPDHIVSLYRENPAGRNPIPRPRSVLPSPLASLSPPP